jgi:hypothetical protein
MGHGAYSHRRIDPGFFLALNSSKVCAVIFLKAASGLKAAPVVVQAAGER